MDPLQGFLRLLVVACFLLDSRLALASTPTWVLERIDVRRPEIKASPVSVVEGAGLSADHSCNVVDQLVVEGCAHQDRLRERRRM